MEPFSERSAMNADRDTGSRQLDRKQNRAACKPVLDRATDQPTGRKRSQNPKANAPELAERRVSVWPNAKTGSFRSHIRLGPHGLEETSPAGSWPGSRSPSLTASAHPRPQPPKPTLAYELPHLQGHEASKMGHGGDTRGRGGPRGGRGLSRCAQSQPRRTRA